MLVKNNSKNRDIQQVVATMAIEEMYFDKSFIDEIIKTDNGEKTLEQFLEETIREYAR